MHDLMICVLFVLVLVSPAVAAAYLGDSSEMRR